jgi:hypothetical protein
MKRILLATALAAALASPALADSITLTATCDGVACGGAASADGNLDVNNQAFGIFNLNTLTINSQQFLAAPGVLSTNTLDVDQMMSGNHTLVLDITANGLAGPNALEAFLSTFSVSGQTAGWSIQAMTLINGNPLATSAVFTGVSDSGSSTDLAFASSLFSAEAIYTITSSGIGQVNGGIDISTAAVPEPATWGMMLLGFAGLAFAFRKRLRPTAMPLAA